MPAAQETASSQAQVAVREAAGRVSRLVRTARHPSAPALGVWDVTDLAAHLSHALDAIVAMAQGGGGLLEDMARLSHLTEGLVEGEIERDLGALADRIDDSAARLLSLLQSADDTSLRTWLVQGVELPVSTLACHFLNELVVHGRDIALAEGMPWPISRSDATLIVCDFLFPVIGALGRMVVDQEEAAGVRVTYDLRVRGGCRVVLRFEDGDLSLTPGAPDRPVDCHLSVDPVAFMLVAWGRIDQWRAIARAQLFAWGRRPWLGPRLRRMLENP
ncbi:MAG: maleylpyruvate isomerase N-terminal domain-containing protein [Actinomycetota bacterium]|nr:maleylpyruvate isomerase N-terminal domain-containing protein [Actinomycetota bacterium]